MSILEKQLKLVEQQKALFESQQFISTIAKHQAILRDAASKLGLSLADAVIDSDYRHNDYFNTHTYRIDADIANGDYDDYLHMSNITRLDDKYVWALSHNGKRMEGAFQDETKYEFGDSKVVVICKLMYVVNTPEDVEMTLRGIGKIVDRYYTNSHTSTEVTC